MQKKMIFGMPYSINRLIKAVLITSCILPQQATAGTMGAANPPTWTWVGALSAGPTWQSGGTRQTFYLTQDIEKTYTANQLTQALFDGEMVLGLQKTVSQTLQVRLGLAAAATGNATLSGAIWDDASPQFDNYTYRYTI